MSTETQSVPPTEVPASTDSSSSSTSSSNTLELRCLIDNNQVGGIIGKAGANVKRIREESGAYVSIVKNDFNRQAHERIMILKGQVNAIAKATALVAQSLVDTNTNRRDNTNTNAPSPDTVSLKLLVHKNGVGCIIGKAGALIRETQTETGARVQVSNDLLPQSTEKAVTISGTPEQVQKAMEKVATQLKENPVKPGTKHYPYTPGAQMYPPPPFPHAPYNNPPMSMYPPSMQHMQHGPTSIGVPSTQKIAIPTVCAGCVIGKNGTVIKDLRVQSGTNISIADPDPNTPQERVVTIIGSPVGINHAIHLIKQLVEQYQPNQN